MKKWKQYAKKTWHFLYHEDSVLSWIANVVIAFVLIKFVLFPLLGAITGTSLPIVAVVSSSMDHRAIDGQICGLDHEDGQTFWDVCGSWYEERGITQTQFEAFPFKNGFWKGDVMLLRGVPEDRLEVGDVVVFQSGKQYPIIHRIVAIDEENGNLLFTTKGDHNPDSIEEFALFDGRYLHTCVTVQANRYFPSPCGPGVERVSEDTPGAIAVLDETAFDGDIIVGRAYGRIPLVGYVKILFVDFLSLIGFGQVAQVI